MGKWVGIEEFVITVQTGSLSRAAQQLNTTKSNISKKISLLEQRLGIKLLHRTQRKVSLTPIGETYFAQSVELLKLLEHNDALILDAKEDIAGPIKLSVPPGISESIIVDIIHRFRQAYPAVEFIFNSSVKKSDLITSAVDIAFRYSEEVDAALIARPLFNSAYRLCASPLFLSQNGPPQSPRELYQVDCLGYSDSVDKNTLEWHFIDPDKGERFIVNPDAKLISDSVSSLARLCELGCGVLYCSDVFVHQPIREGKLVPLFQDWIYEKNKLWIVYADRKALTRRVRAFIEYALDYPYESMNPTCVFRNK